MKTPIAKIILVALCLITVGFLHGEDPAYKIRGFRQLRVGGNVVEEPYPPTIQGFEFNEGSGTAFGSSFGPGGTEFGGVWITPGASGGGAAFNTVGGDTTYTANSATTYGANVITVSFWIRRTSWGTDNGIGYIAQSSATWLNDANMWRVAVRTNLNYIEFGMAGTTGASVTTYNLTSPSINVWHHVAGVFDGSTAPGEITIYLNGVLQSVTADSASKDGTSNFASNNLRLMEPASSLDFDFDDFRIYAGALSAAQIYQIYLHPR